jgi:hypothetical protein
MEADELQTISAMVEESSKTIESVGQFVLFISSSLLDLLNLIPSIE